MESYFIPIYSNFKPHKKLISVKNYVGMVFYAFRTSTNKLQFKIPSLHYLSWIYYFFSRQQHFIIMRQYSELKFKVIKRKNHERKRSSL